jgi:feruloyl esterase
MLMSQRNPLYFDGIVAGSPAMRTGHSNLATRTVTVNLNKIAPKGPNGQPLPGGGLADTDRKAIIAKILDVCDARDGMKDGMIFDVAGCTFKPADLQCPAAKMEGCLSKEQVDAITIAFAGPKDSRGNQVYPGFFFDTGITATGGGIPGLLATGNSPIGPPTTAVSQDIDVEAARVNSNATALIGDSWTWTNLSTFSSHGGKLLFYHGVSDPWFSANDTVDYYQRMTAANGGASQVMNWSRLYLAPGMGHCGGGAAALDSFDLLSAVVDWVEKGTAPDSVIATGRAFPGRSRPMCVYPKHAHYKGAGDIEDAKNFTCEP